MDEKDFIDEFIDNNHDFKIEDETPEEKEEKQKSNHVKKILFLVFGVIAVALVGLAVFAGYTLYQNDKAPIAKTVHIESDNVDGHGIATYGNMITLTVTFNKTLSNKPTITIQDKRVEVFGDGKEFYAKYFVQTQGYTEEEVKFMIYDYKDDFRKVGDPITTTTDLSKVVILGLN